MYRTYCIYILRCADDSYYTGMINNLESRFLQHESGKDPGAYTFKRRPLTVVYAATFEDVWDAIHWEKQIKRWSRRKKEALIRGEWEVLSGLAVCMNASNTMTTVGRIRADVHRKLGNVVPRLRSG